MEKFFQGQSSQEQEVDGEFPSILNRLFYSVKMYAFHWYCMFMSNNLFKKKKCKRVNSVCMKSKQQIISCLHIKQRVIDAFHIKCK